MALKALAFDTGGTILDWHGGINRAFAAAGSRCGVVADWPAITNEYRRRSLRKMIGQVDPAFNFDDVHRETLEEIVRYFRLDALTPEDRNAIWRAWYALDAWPDFPEALARLRQRFIVVSLTLLTTSLVISVSRKNFLQWDAIISCQMTRFHKPHPEAYQRAAQWLALEPEEILMVACHNFDLNAARACGYRSAFVRRRAEWGAEQPPDPVPNPAHDFIVESFPDLAGRLGA